MLGYVLSIFLYFLKFEPQCSYKHGSYSKKSVHLCDKWRDRTRDLQRGGGGGRGGGGSGGGGSGIGYGRSIFWDDPLLTDRSILVFIEKA